MKFGVRRSRLLGAIWVLAGLALVVAAFLLWLDRRSFSWFELPLGVVAIAVGVHLFSQHVEMDRHGLTMASWWDSERVLWASIDHVEIRDTWLQPALVMRRKGDGASQEVAVTSGLTATQRVEMFDVLHDLARDHGFEVRRDGEPVAAAGEELDGTVATTASAHHGRAVGASDRGSVEVDQPGVPDEDGSMMSHDADDSVSTATDGGDDELAGAGSEDAMVEVTDDPDDATGEGGQGGEDGDVADDGAAVLDATDSARENVDPDEDGEDADDGDRRDEVDAAGEADEVELWLDPDPEALPEPDDADMERMGVERDDDPEDADVEEVRDDPDVDEDHDQDDPEVDAIDGADDADGDDDADGEDRDDVVDGGDPPVDATDGSDETPDLDVDRRDSGEPDGEVDGPDDPDEADPDEESRDPGDADPGEDLPGDRDEVDRDQESPGDADGDAVSWLDPDPEALPDSGDSA